MIKSLKKLAKKYRSLTADLSNMVEELIENPTLGQPLGKNVFKVRMSISSKSKGKSGGARVITYFLKQENEVHLLSIYDKSAQTTISNQSVINLINNIIK